MKSFSQFLHLNETKSATEILIDDFGMNPKHITNEDHANQILNKILDDMEEKSKVASSKKQGS